ncbi:hypothetical protein L1887_36826 [Cichorium endivia]|nr:hypothetical protein L1887_36826 [Cichorium endivia]
MSTQKRNKRSDIIEKHVWFCGKIWKPDCKTGQWACLKFTSSLLSMAGGGREVVTQGASGVVAIGFWGKKSMIGASCARTLSLKSLPNLKVGNLPISPGILFSTDQGNL